VRRLVGFVLVLTAVAMITTSCKREEDQKLAIGRFITATEQRSRKFVYLDQTRKVRTQVTGVVEDDFRYKTRLTVNGTPVEDEVTSDDALAVRFLAPDQLTNFLASPSLAALGSSAGALSPILALETRRWVLDKSGAPQLLASATDRRKEGDDPVFDSLTALQYVRRAVNLSVQVKKYKKDDVEPVYKEKEDPFPKPKAGSKVTRYDMRPPAMPKADARGATGNQQTPGESNFRKIAVYVRDGVIVEVREVIDVASKLDDLIRIFKLPNKTTVDTAVFAINAVRAGQGDDLVRVRNMSLQFQDIGSDLKVELPTEVVDGSLTILKFRGRQPIAGTPTPTPQA